MEPRALAIRGGIELDDDESAAHDAPELAQGLRAIADVADRRQTDREIDRAVREWEGFTGGADDPRTREVMAWIDGNDQETRMACCSAPREGRRTAAEIEQVLGAAEGEAFDQPLVEVSERGPLVAGIPARTATLERMAVKEPIEERHVHRRRRFHRSASGYKVSCATCGRGEGPPRRFANPGQARRCYVPPRMKRPQARRLFVSQGLAGALVIFAACGGSSDSGGIPAECNPLGGAGCMLPWPSMTYAKVDSSTATGFRLDVPTSAMPVNVDGIPVDSAWLDRWDGFSAVGPILVAFPTGVSVQGLPTHQNPDESLAPTSPIILVDMNTGERAPFFAEIDQNTIDPLKRNLIIRPLARLHTSARYAVAIRKSVKAADGGELPIPPAFQAILDGGDFGHPKFGELKSRYTEIFDVLATAGVDKTDLVLAWDFVTVSDEYLRGDLTAMRAAALPAIGTNGANLSFTATEKPNTPTSFKRYLGTFKSPDFLTNGEENDSILRRDAANVPQMQGLRDANFAAIIPSCVATQPLPRPTIIFGHGLFGSAEEYLNDDFVAQLAEDHCLVILAGDFIGLTSRQFPLAPLAVNDLNRGPQITEKLAQSIVDFMALESIARGPMAAAPEFKFNGQPVIDPAKTYYVGGSLGGIMGNTFMAYDPNITRGVLAVPGGNWSMLLERSTAWALLLGASQGAYEDPEVYQLNLALALGMGFESIDPMTTAAHVIKDPLFGNPVKNILMWYSIGDCLVTNIATEMVAREMGIQVIAPSVKSPWGLTPVPGPLANGVTIYNDHPTPLPLDTNVPPITDNGTHSGINKKPAPLREVQQFLLQNTVVDECKVNSIAAPCDCQTGACD